MATNTGLLATSRPVVLSNYLFPSAFLKIRAYDVVGERLQSVDSVEKVGFSARQNSGTTTT